MSFSFVRTGEAPSWFCASAVLAIEAGGPALRCRRGFGVPCCWILLALLAGTPWFKLFTAFCATAKFAISRRLYKHLMKPLDDVFEFKPKFWRHPPPKLKPCSITARPSPFATSSFNLMLTKSSPILINGFDYLMIPTYLIWLHSLEVRVSLAHHLRSQCRLCDVFHWQIH